MTSIQQLTELAGLIPSNSAVHASVTAAIALGDEEHAGHTLATVQRHMGAEETRLTRAMATVQRDLSRAALASAPTWSFILSMTPRAAPTVDGPRDPYDTFEPRFGMAFRATDANALEVVCPVNRLSLLRSLPVALGPVEEFIGNTMRGNAPEVARRAALISVSERK